MYRLGEIEHRHRKFYALLAVVIALIIVGSLLLNRFVLKSNTKIGSPPPVLTTHISYDNTKLTTFDEPLFSIGLPTDWKPATHATDIPQPTYSWQGTAKDDTSRWINIYIDQNIAGLAVNRELSVQSTGSTINVLGQVSDNCTTFTGTASQSSASTPAKWQGIDFLCDSSNYERDVVGVASPDGLNTVILTGSTGSHHFFITYTDNSPAPDYSFFTSALKSLQAK